MNVLTKAEATHHAGERRQQLVELEASGTPRGWI